MNYSRMIANKRFNIEPEYLETEEIRHELIARSVDSIGSRRAITFRLKDIINHELTQQGAFHMCSVGFAPDEITYIENQVLRIKTLLYSVGESEITQQQFISVYMHLESRLGRVIVTNPELKQRASELKKQFDDIYKEFTERINIVREVQERRMDSKAQSLGSEHFTSERPTGTKPKERYDPMKDYELPKLNRDSFRPIESQKNESYQNVANNIFQDKAVIGAVQSLHKTDTIGSKNMSLDLEGIEIIPSNRNITPGAGIFHGTKVSNDEGRFSQQFFTSNPRATPVKHAREERQCPNPEAQAFPGNNQFDYLNNAFSSAIDPNVMRNDEKRTVNQQPELLRVIQEQYDSVNRTNSNICKAIEELAIHVANSNREAMNRTPNRTPFGYDHGPQNQYEMNEDAHHFAQPSSRANVHQNHNSYDGYRNNSRLAIHKWNWHFSGDQKSKITEEKDVHAFLKKIEMYKDAEGATDEEVFRKFHHLVRGSAYEWFCQYRSRFLNWQQLKNGLLTQYTTPLTPFMKMAEISQRRQKDDESAMDYIASISREFDAMDIHGVPERISMIQNGLKNTLRERVVGRVWFSVQEMDLFLRQVEVADNLRARSEPKPSIKTFVPRRFVKKINVVDYGDQWDNVENEMYEIEESNEDDNGTVSCNVVKAKPSFRHTNPKNYRKANEKVETAKDQAENTKSEEKKALMQCFNCKGEHRFIDCEEPITRIFCFRCGKEGKRSPKCDSIRCTWAKNSKNVACLEEVSDEETHE